MIKKLFAILLLLFGIGSVCATEQTNYPYYIEDMGNGQYNIWTKVNVSANSNKTIYIKKVDGYSPNGDDVFEFFDDFEKDSLDTNKWTGDITGFSIENGKLKGTSTTYRLETIRKFSDGYVAETKVYTQTLAEYGQQILGFYTSSSDNFGILEHPDNDYYRVDSYWHTIGNVIPEQKNFKITIKTISNTQVYYEITNLDTGKVTKYETVSNSVINEPITIGKRYDNGYTGQSYKTYWDYILVRKYVNQEPTVSIEQINDNTWKVTITNPNSYDLNGFQVKIDGAGIVSSKTDSLLIVDNINPQYLTLTTPDLWNINTPVNATVSGYNISQGTIIYLDWGDGVIDNQIYNGEDLQFQHTYTETGTYPIKSYVNTYIITEKQIIITENLTTGILTFKPLYENTTITGWAIVNGMNVSMENNTTLYGILGKPVKIQTDKGYISSIPFSTNMTAYIAGSEYQYITVSLSADNPITVKNGEKVVGYGKNVYITQPVGDTITVWCNNKKIREYLLRSSIDDYIYIPKQHITANIRENNGILAVYLETWRKEKLHINIQKEDTTIYETEGYYEGFQRIDTGNTPEAGNTYKLTILNEDGNIVSYSTYTYTPETQKPNIPEQEGYIWIAFLIGVVIMIMGVISDNLPIALIGIGLFVLLVPYHMPYLDHLAAISTALAIIIIISRHIKRNAGD